MPPSVRPACEEAPGKLVFVAAPRIVSRANSNRPETGGKSDRVQKTDARLFGFFGLDFSLMNYLSGQLEPRKRSFSSWLLSVTVHVALLILLAEAIRSPQARGFPERGRDVGIALAEQNGETTEYFDQSDGDRKLEADAAENSSDNASRDFVPSEEALADIQQPDVALPGPAAPAPTDALIPKLDYSPGRRGNAPSQADIAAARAADALRRRQRGSSGPSTEVSLFGSAPAVGNSFIFVIDRSDSMGRDGLGVISRAKREFQRSLSALESVHRFQLVAYNHEHVFLGGKRKFMPATEPNKQLIDKFLGGLAAFGATNHFSAIMTALYRSPDVVFLLTDGGNPTPSYPQMVRILKQARGQTTIHCVQFGRRPFNGEDNFLGRLARETGGSFRYVNVSR